MMVKELLSGIGDINDRYIMEAEEIKQRSGKIKVRRVLILAAALAGVLAISTLAATENWFGLRDLILGQMEEENTTLSLVGLAETPEYLAAAQWQEFLASYDTDGKILESIGNGIYAPGTSYPHYNVYSQEMADKLDEIAEEHQLKLHTDILLNLQPEDLYAQVGGDFLGDNRAFAAYMYEDGTFHFDGVADLAGYGLLDYQFDRVVKGSFNSLRLNIGPAEDYAQWNYTTQDGVPLLLALSPYKGLIMADLADCFITVNVLAGTETAPEDVFSSGPLTAENLQCFADSFRFNVLTPVLPADMSYAEDVWVDGEKIAPEAFYNATGIEFYEAQAFYAEFLKVIESGNRLTAVEKICYPAVVIMPDGTETRVENASQLLEFYDAIFTEELWEQITITRYDLERADLFWYDGQVGAASGFIWFGLLPEEGLRVLTVQSESGAAVRSANP